MTSERIEGSKRWEGKADVVVVVGALGGSDA